MSNNLNQPAEAIHANFYQQIRKQILFSLTAVLLMISLIGTYSYKINVQQYTQQQQQLLEAFLQERADRLRTQWQRLKKQPVEKQKQWLLSLKLPHSLVTLTQNETQTTTHPQITIGALPDNSKPHSPSQILSTSIDLEPNTYLTIQQKVFFPTPYIQFMTRPIMAIVMTVLIIWFFLGRWAKRKQRKMALLQKAIDAYHSRKLDVADQYIQRMRTNSKYRDEITDAAEAFHEMTTDLNRLNTQIKKTSQTLELLEEVIIELDANHQILSANLTWQAIQKQNGIYSQNFLDYLSIDDRTAWFEIVHQAIQKQKNYFKIRFRLCHGTDSTMQWYEGRFIINRQNPEDPTISGILQDIHSAYLQEQKIQHMALHDALTHLPNRVLLEDRLQQAIAQAKRNNSHVGILLFDLDHFKQINDTLGHSQGDKLLKQASKRIQNLLRAQDTLARWGGDEFVILLPDLPACKESLTVAHKVIQTFQKGFYIDSEPLVTTCSIGISCYPDDGEEMESLFANADKAMYHAKQQGRNQAILYQKFKAEMENGSKLTLTNALSQALKNHEITCYYQPIIDAKTGKVVSVEALARWKNGDQFVPPETFIPLAEDMGLICELGESIMQQSIILLKELKKSSLLPRININVSTRQLFTKNFHQAIENLCKQHQIQPSDVNLEVTESIAIRDVNFAVERLQKLKLEGFTIALDDFGTGYASLSQLSELQPGKLKIDRSFVNQIDTQVGREILESIIKIGHTLKMEVVAEGVETESQKAQLEALNINHLQGYLIAKPMPEQELMEWLQAQSN